MTSKLVVEHCDAKLVARALNTVVDLLERADGVVAVDDALARLVVEAAQQVEGVVRHKAAPIQCVAKQFSDRVEVRLSLVLHHVDADSRDKVLVKRIDVSNHAPARENARFRKLRAL